MSELIEIRPQPGPQTDFLCTTADIAIYGGAAGGGKSFALLVEPLRHFGNKLFGGVIFRRETVQIRNEGGLWDESMKIYLPLGLRPHEGVLEWSGELRMKFAHLQHERNVYDWQGSQIPFIGFDELTHFTERQFTYMMSRNRSTSGVPGYIRATCNPDADSWVRKWIDWWIGPDGYPIKERSGVIRWFIRIEDELIWGNSREELVEKYGEKYMPKSFTFIPSSITDNQILMQKDPSYMANLLALPRVDRLRLLGGNWDVRATAGMFFHRDWFQVVDAIPGQVIRWIRAWDLAATKVTPEKPDPDWTRGVRMGKLADGRFIISHVASMRDTPLQVERLLKNTASQDGVNVEVSLAQDPGSAGVVVLDHYTRLLAGYIIKSNRPSSDKVTRAKPLSAQCEAGNVLILRGAWNEEFFKELENFDGENGHDDQVDAAADAFNELCGNLSILNVL